ncbi:(deoxy)nucleoside triphosphate pyrophosphohydrolase [Dubosiella newyorkensis]|uniref:8-oxo-dGTP diphosphatase n=1 Tax=Dubosiella newyorkensis TaxID=1862672 RepID=A0A1U7NP01_9FIRM|nr:(deoxy)nucleoside triphosphate pyrophosphohydrolase [Dubosiella newyorkensis]OLU47208.1 DNA mismatch repair protein MutT [Dubosiella newyorkensis]
MTTSQIKKKIHVVAGILIQNGKILATQRGYGEFKGGWEFPGGKVEPHETKEEALVRELKEELKVDTSIQKFYEHIDYEYPSFLLSMDCFIGTIKNGELQLVEHEAAKWVLPADLLSIDWLPADLPIAQKLAQDTLLFP